MMGNIETKEQEMKDEIDNCTTIADIKTFLKNRLNAKYWR